MSPCHMYVAFQRILEAFFMFFKYKKMIFNGVQEKESIILVRIGLKIPSLVIIVCHHLASLVMPNGDHWDGFFSIPISHL